ncbi:PEP-CTERM system histidine kinase PrsK [Catenovulum sp. SM1970]|uniref:XrtA/PEP-CTERM system histidine kinase PrsK n=1 Tax=Marinifaba aquimaris TaxID=2741323 RepID=UPI001574CBD2|nr:XrtA/PEP-CTERM system histidine kinase PrsK [Marinifaba aquimaris]NTS75964.1 PEP-CTERM system histidine kinase PrsK [Marinifaba aquimaris]
MELLSGVGYSLASVAFLLTGFLLLTTQTQHYIKNCLLCFCTLTCIWSGVYSYTSFNSQDAILYIPLLETIKNVAWLLLITGILNTNITSFRQHLTNTVFLLPALVFSLPTFAIYFFNLPTSVSHQLLILASVISPLLQLIFIEQLYRKSENDLWGYKPFIIAIATASIFDFYIFSESLLVQKFEPHYLTARAYVYLVVVPFIVLSIKRIQSWNLRIYVSREIVLQSSLLMLAGLYFLLMAAVGYFINSIGATWSGAMQVIFSCIAILFILTVFISDNFRKAFKIYIGKHFFANQFDYREEWLKLTKTLESSSNHQTCYQAGLRGMLNAIQYNRGAYYRVSKSGVESMANINMSLNVNALNEIVAILPVIKESHWIFDIEAIKTGHSDYKDMNLSVENLHTAKINILIPVFVANQLHGLFLLGVDNHTTKLKLNWEIRDYINAITSQIGSYFSLQETSSALAENAQFAAFNRMSAFVVHDLKNVVAQINLIIQNSQHHKHNPEFIDDTFETLEHTQARMTKMLDLLMNKQVTDEQKQFSNLNILIEKLLKTKFENTSPLPDFAAADWAEMAIDPDRFSHVLAHLIDNAQQACDESGQVNINLHKTDSHVHIEITDTGCGMSDDFIQNRLFKPFDTTKGNAGMGIGAYDAKVFAESYSGQLNVDSQLGEGTKMTMILAFNKEQ